MSQVKLSMKEDWDLVLPWEKAWCNMLDYIESQVDTLDEDGEITDAGIRKELKKSGGRWLALSESVVFPNEKTYAHWLLRWS